VIEVWGHIFALGLLDGQPRASRNVRLGSRNLLWGIRLAVNGKLRQRLGQR
jgi:hypothetical protein